MRTSNRKLWLWVCEDFMPDYSDGLAVAVAASEVEAKRLIEKPHWPGAANGFTFKRYRLDQRRAFSCSGGA